MATHHDEDAELRSVAIQNAQSILQARQRAERELAESLAMMRATLESSTDAIVAIDGAGRVSAFNERFAQMWGLSRELLENGGDAPQIEAICQHFDSDSFDVLQLPDGRVVERYSRNQVVDGRITGRVWSFRDITETRRLYESERAARASAERMSEMKDEFLATLSHELRTPLSAILGWAQILRRRPMAPPELQRALETIERNARVQAQLIEDLLDMSRITSGKLRLEIQPLEPAAVIEAALDTVRPAAEAKGIRLEKLLDPDAGPISGDPHRLQQVAWNLLSNAIKFTPRGGKVQVLLERVNSHIEISVADTGIGIQPEFLTQVFDRFLQADASTTRRYGGLGLGLSIVRHLVELHGGTVTVKSAGENRGATFTVQLPLTVVHRRSTDELRLHPRTPKDTQADYKPADLSGVKVLVVDDEPDARELIRSVLEECNATVLAAASATEALELAERERPELLLSDIGMPGIDGYELLKRVRALGADSGGRVAAIALTAFARSEDRTRALRAGFMAHISKPVEPAELVATVASVAGRAG
jgi:signal transduction histidine kinase/ActR/RegA family two-component response regulator